MTRRGMRRLAILAGIVVTGTIALGVAVTMRNAAREQKFADARESGMSLYEEIRARELEGNPTFHNDEYKVPFGDLNTAISGIKDDPALFKAFARSRAAVPAPNGKHLPAAISAAKSAIRLAPDDLESKELLLTFYYEIGYFSELIELADEIISLDPPAKSLENAYSLKFMVNMNELGAIEQATQTADTWFDARPDSFDAFNARILAAVMSGVPTTESVEWAREVTPRFEDNPGFMHLLSRLEYDSEAQVLRGDDAEPPYRRSIDAARQAALLPPASAKNVIELDNWLRRLHSELARIGALPEGSPDELIVLADERFERALADTTLGAEVASRALERSWWDRDREQTERFVEVITSKHRATGTGSEGGEQPDAAPNREGVFWAIVAMIGDRPGKGVPLDSPEITALTSLAGESSGDEGAGPHPIHLALDRLRAGDPQGVVPVLADSLSGSADDQHPELAAYIRGVAALRYSDFAGAIAELRPVAESNESRAARAWDALSTAFLLAQEKDRARNNARAAYTNTPEELRTLESLSLTDKQLDLIDSYLKDWQAAAESDGSETIDASDLRIGNSLLVDTIENIREIPTTSRSEPWVSLYLARALLLFEQPDEAFALASRALSEASDFDYFVMDGLENFENAVTWKSPDRITDAAALSLDRGGLPEMIVGSLTRVALTDSPEAARSLLRERIASAEGTDAERLRRTEVLLLDAIASGSSAALQDETREAAEADATRAAVALSDDYPESAAAQFTALHSGAIWRDSDATLRAIERAETLTAAGSPSGEPVGSVLTARAFRVKHTLRHDPTKADIIDALGVLAEIRLRSPDDYETLMLSAEAYRAAARFDLDPTIEGASPENAAASFDQAISYYERAITTGLGDRAYQAYHDTLVEAGRSAEADRLLNRFVTLGRPSRQALVQRRNLLIESGRIAEAAEDQARLSGPQTPKSMLDLAGMYRAAGNRSEAIQALDNLLENRGLWETDQPNDILEAAAISLAESGAVARALEVFKQLPDPFRNRSVDSIIARALVRVGRPAEALPYQRSVAREAGTPEAWISVIRTARTLGDDSLQASIVREAIEALPDSPELRAYEDPDSLRSYSASVLNQSDWFENEGGASFQSVLADHARGTIDDETLVERLEQLHADHPGLIAAWNYHGRVLVQLGSPDEVVAITRRAADANPDSVPALRLLISALIDTGRIAEAIEPAERVMVLNTQDPYLSALELANLVAQTGDYPRVIALLSPYRARIEAEVTDTPSQALTALAVAYAGIGNVPEARSLFESRLQSGSPAWQNTALRAAQALPLDAAEARRAWIAPITYPALQIDLATQYAQLALATGDVADARRGIAVLESNRQPENPNWVWALGNLEIGARNHAAAEEAFRSLITLQEDSPLARSLLGDVLSRQPDRASEAIRVLDLASNLYETSETPIPPGDTISRARALLELDRAEDALATLTPLLDSDTTPPAALVLAGKCHLLLGNQNQAVEYRDLAAIATPSDFLTRESLESLSSMLD